MGAAGGGGEEEVRVCKGGAAGSSASRLRTLISTVPLAEREASLLVAGERKPYELHMAGVCRVCEQGKEEEYRRGMKGVGGKVEGFD